MRNVAENTMKIIRNLMFNLTDLVLKQKKYE